IFQGRLPMSRLHTSALRHIETSTAVAEPSTTTGERKPVPAGFAAGATTGQERQAATFMQYTRDI
ncbi:hypothetical protein, partial [Xanthomonas fragariae]